MALARARARTWLDREPDPTLIQISNPDRRKEKRKEEKKYWWFSVTSEESYAKL